VRGMGNGRNGVTIRRARASDAARIAELSGQLGYPATPREMAGRLKSVLREKHSQCYVAEAKLEGVIGWVHVIVTSLLEEKKQGEIKGLVVDEMVRSRGAGAKLLDEAEKWARRMGCKGMSVRSNVFRERAHEFYLRQGYEHYKTQKAFRKSL